MAKKYSLVKSNEKIRGAIIKRIEELKLSQHDIIVDAQIRGYKLPVDMLNRYLKHGDVRGSLREDQIIWLATRYGIYINMGIGKPIISDTNQIAYEVSKYNEEEALRALSIIYPSKN